jgi:hypothetical protein
MIRGSNSTSVLSCLLAECIETQFIPFQKESVGILRLKLNRVETHVYLYKLYRLPLRKMTQRMDRFLKAWSAEEWD